MNSLLSIFTGARSLRQSGSSSPSLCASDLRSIEGDAKESIRYNLLNPALCQSAAHADITVDLQKLNTKGKERYVCEVKIKQPMRRCCPRCPMMTPKDVFKKAELLKVFDQARTPWPNPKNFIDKMSVKIDVDFQANIQSREDRIKNGDPVPTGMILEESQSFTVRPGLLSGHPICRSYSSLQFFDM